MRGEVEIIEDRGRQLTELGPVDRLAVGEAQLVALMNLPGGVDRGEEVTVAVVSALRALHIVAAVGDEFHLVELKAHSGIHLHPSHRQQGRKEPCAQGVASLVVVAHAELFKQSETVVAEIVGIGEQFGHVHLAESVGQRVLLHVPVVNELSGGIAA